MDRTRNKEKITGISAGVNTIKLSFVRRSLYVRGYGTADKVSILKTEKVLVSLMFLFYPAPDCRGWDKRLSIPMHILCGIICAG